MSPRDKLAHLRTIRIIGLAIVVVILFLLLVFFAGEYSLLLVVCCAGVYVAYMLYMVIFEEVRRKIPKDE